MFSRGFTAIRCFYASQHRGRNSFRYSYDCIQTTVGAMTGALIGVGLVYAKENSKKSETKNLCREGQRKKFTLEEVSRHDSPENGIWVTYKENVYDITEFVNQHPGGRDKIMMASGSSLDQYFAFYPIHHNKRVQNLLEEYRIGSLVEEDREAMAIDEDPYGNEPPRNPLLIACVIKPFVAGTPPEVVIQDYITTNELHYVRNHMPDGTNNTI